MNAELVAVVASHRLSSMARGLLRRCGFVVVEPRSLDDARKLIERGPVPAFVVVMPCDAAGHAAPLAADTPVSAFIDAIRSVFSPDHVVAVQANGFPADELRRCEAAGMRVLPGGRFSIRRLARFLIQLQGSDGTRCCPSASEHARRTRAE
jgi:hypothetical protein